MKMELIDKVLQRMIGVINESQLQELRMALVMVLEGVTVQREVHWLPLYCKKGRPGWQLQVICAHEDIERLQTIIFLETTTNGIRRQVMERVCLPRRFEQVTTPWGEVSVKVATLPDGSERAAPEYEDCARLAREHGVPLQRVMQAAQAAALQFE